ncbi:FAA24 [Candida oxycetoniae]|uniref:FAA24 n=1 Tax=Candida oxycetoniae TaxID=497107 RepID=A0AAI9SZT4_9ASCO|nr:FAA24 [Candida oxycetoniae]KAI3406238.2 FAA24 [Candida oxycetoniae]
MSSLYSGSDFTADLALSHLPFKQDVHQSVPLPRSSSRFSLNSANYSKTFRNKVITNRLIESIHPDLNTHPQLFNHAAKRFKDRPCLSSRPYDYAKKQSASCFNSFTYQQVWHKKNNIGSGILRALLANPYLDEKLESHRKIKNHLRDWSTYGVASYLRDNKDHEIEKSCSFILSIFAVNRLEWVLTDLACSSYAITSTALYDTLGSDTSQYILDLTKCPIVVCTSDKVGTLLKLKQTYPKETESVISIISMDPIATINKDALQLANQLKVQITDLASIEKLGEKQPITQLSPSPDALFTISFTSGTTGSKPKGVMIPHRCAAAYVSFLTSIQPHAQLGDKAYVLLPLTHLYERETSAFAWTNGYELGFPQTTVGQTKIDTFHNMIDDLKLFQPTYMSVVPRLLTKLETLIKEQIKQLSPNNQVRVNQIIEYKVKKQGSKDGATGFDAMLDSFEPYKSLRDFIGFNEMRWVQTASAPIASSTLIYLKASLNMGIRQLYGLTESGAAITCTDAYEASPGTCGSISMTGEFKLRSVRDMGYDINKLEGEILLRGPQMFKGYYYNQEETNKAVNEEGWFHSGDIATIDSDGRIRIIDRVKNFFKMQQGEYISPEKIENRYLSSNPVISQLYVHGDSLKSYLVGIVGIEYEQGLKFLNQNFGLNKIDMSCEELLQKINTVEAKTKFLAHLNSNVCNQLNGFELLHNIHIEINPLTVEREVVTPTFKLRRPVAQKFFANVFHKLYEIEKSLVIEARLQMAKL